MPERFAIVFPIEAEIKPNGSSRAIFRVVASDEEIAASAMKEIDEEFGSTSRKMSKAEVQNRLTFDFTASNWKMCSWEPQGPKKNWRIPPDNPALN